MLRITALLLLAAGPRSVAAAKVSQSWPESSGGGWWPFSSSESTAAGSLPSDVQALVHSPGDAVLQDEALPVSQLSEAAPAQQRPAALLATRAATSPGFMQPQKMAMPEELIRAPSASEANTVEEFDEQTAKGVTDIATEGVLAALFEEQPGAKESMTLEEQERLASGDVKYVAPQAQLEEAAPAASTQEARPAAALASQKARVTKGKPDMQAQCMAFALWAKGTGIEGKEVTKLFMSSCDPSAKGASESYKKMCSELEPKITELETDPNWLPEKACAIVVKHFQLSGVGSNPLVG
eukprot:gb/GFBE01074493.1/.p1 GENE.gb/GFBE01074493.1/~~gb/GFBE01074493.1/.p1  ORF type:complete len:296 (+),score=85.02 gb/GFBE01074493.1/:1-888(+)